jgi:hypothetical protein
MGTGYQKKFIKFFRKAVRESLRFNKNQTPSLFMFRQYLAMKVYYY